MASFIRYNGFSPGTDGYGFWWPKVYKVASSPANGSVWRNVLSVKIAHGGVFAANGANVSDMDQTGDGNSSVCGSGVNIHQTIYRRWATFASPKANTSALEVQWQVDTDGWSASSSYTGLSYSSAPITDTHEFDYPLGPGTGVDDGSDHLVKMQWRAQNTSDGGWSVWHSGNVSGPILHNEAGC